MTPLKKLEGATQKKTWPNHPVSFMSKQQTPDIRVDLKTNKLLHCEICWENWCTDLVTNQPLWSVWKRVLMGIQPNSVTVLMYVAVETEEDHELAKEVQPAEQVCELDNHRKSCAAWYCFFSLLLFWLLFYCTCSFFQWQLPQPGVDQDSLSRARGASQHNLSQ